MANNPKLSRLAHNVAMVYPETGWPTPIFQRLIQQLLEEKAATEGDVTTIEGDITNITNTVANLELDDLVDVDTTSTPPTDGQAVVWDDDASLWVPGSVAAGGSNPFQGAMVRKSVDQTAANYTTITAVTWDTEDYDTHGFHDNSSNTSRLTIPAGVTKVQLFAEIRMASVTANDDVLIEIWKNGSAGAVPSTAAQRASGVSVNPTLSFASPVINVSAGDYFEVALQLGTDTSITLTANRCYFAIKAVESTMTNSTTFRGALVKKAADETAANYSAGAAITWDSEVYDTDGFHSTSASTDRLTVPAGVTRARLSFGVGLTNVTAGSDVYIDVLKNGAAFNGFNRIIFDTASITSLRGGGVSAIVSVSTGDYFTVVMTSADNSITVEAYATWFAVEVLENTITPAGTTFRGAMVRKAADQTAANYSSETAIAWDSEIRDTDGFHDNSSNNTRLTVPAGVTKVKVGCTVYGASVTAASTMRLRIGKNAATTFEGTAVNSINAPFTTTGFSCVTSVLSVSAGDYFEAFYTNSDTSTDILASASTFWIEVVETTIANTTTFDGCKVRKAAELTAQDVTSQTAVTWDTESWDTGGYHSTSTNTDRLTVTTGGYYHCGGQMRLKNISASMYALIVLGRYNSAGVLQETVAEQIIEVNNSGYWARINISGTAYFSSGDFLRMLVQVETDTSTDIGTDSWLEIRRLPQ